MKNLLRIFIDLACVLIMLLTFQSFKDDKDTSGQRYDFHYYNLDGVQYVIVESNFNRGNFQIINLSKDRRENNFCKKCKK